MAGPEGSAAGAGDPGPPSRLLVAATQVASFVGREQLLGELRAWLGEPGDAGLARLVVGPAGQGKTRLALKLCADLDVPGWTAGFLRAGLDGDALAEALASQQATGTRCLLVVDYAETRPDQLANLLAHLPLDGRVRLLLLARTRNAEDDWWRTAMDHAQLLPLAREWLEALDEHPLPALAQDLADQAATPSSDLEEAVAVQQRALLRAALDRFAQVRHQPKLPLGEAQLHRLHWPPEAPVLQLHMTALAILLAATSNPSDGGDHAVEATRNRDPAELILAHERRYWQRSWDLWHQQGRLPRTFDSGVVLRLVAAATLCQPLVAPTPHDDPAQPDAVDREDDAWMLGGRILTQALATPRLRTVLDQAATTEAIVWLQSLYPGGLERLWAGLQPDLLAEEFTAQITQPTDHPSTDAGGVGVRDPQLPARLLTTVPLQQAAQGLWLLARAAPRHPHLPPLIRTLIIAHANQLALPALWLTPAAPDQTLADALLDAVQHPHPPELLTTLAGQLPERSVRLLAAAVRITERVAQHHRQLAEHLGAIPADRQDLRLRATTWTPQQQGAVADLAGSLDTLAIRLLEVGRREDALAPAEEATRLWRALAERNPDAHTPNLGGTLNTLSNCLMEAGRHKDALAPAEEATSLWRALAGRNPDVHTRGLAVALHNLADRLSEVGRREEAVDPAEEAVALRRALAERNPDAYIPDLAASLHNLAVFLSRVGRREDALARAEEAIALRRALAERNPDAHMPGLAGSLTNLAAFLSEAGRREDALAPAEEAAALRRALAERNPDAYTPDLARALHNLAHCLKEVGRREDALGPAEEATRLYRALAERNPDAYTPDLAMSLHNLALFVSGVGRPVDALSAVEEAVALCWALAERNPDAYTPRLASSLSTLASCLSAAGRPEDAVDSAKEATRLWRALAERNPDAHTPMLAGSLNNLSNDLYETGRLEDALDPAEEATRLYRALAERNPDAYIPNLAAALTNLAIQLGGVGRREDALGPAEEATRLYRALAERNPDAHTPGLAAALTNLASRLSWMGHGEDALGPAEEATRLYRVLYDRSPAAYGQNFAISLRGLARILDQLGQQQEAASIRQEAEAVHAAAQLQR